MQVYIITKPELQNKLITVYVFSFKLLLSRVSAVSNSVVIKCSSVFSETQWGVVKPSTSCSALFLLYYRNLATVTLVHELLNNALHLFYIYVMELNLA